MYIVKRQMERCLGTCIFSRSNLYMILLNTHLKITTSKHVVIVIPSLTLLLFKSETFRHNRYCMRTFTRYSQINYMDQCITKYVLYVYTMETCSILCCNTMTV